MKATACLTSLFIVIYSVAAAPLDRRDDACPDPLAKIRPILSEFASFSHYIQAILSHTARTFTHLRTEQLTKPSGSPGQLDFKKVDWTKVMIDSQPLINEIKVSLPKLAAGQ